MTAARYESRVALVTGASRGLGPHVALELASRGCDVAVSARSVGELRRVAERIGDQTGRRALAVPGDLTIPEDRGGIIDQVESRLGPIDVLANVAGVGAAERFENAEVARVLATNLEAPMDVTRRVVPGMIERRFGQILNVASLAGTVGLPYLAAYSASKAGLISFSVALREEMRGTGVSVTVVSPGFLVDEGMYVAYGTPVPWYLGSNRSAEVARNAVDALVHERGHVILNRVPMRPLVAIDAVSDPMMRSITRGLGATRFLRGLTNVEMAPAAGENPS